MRFNSIRNRGDAYYTFSHRTIYKRVYGTLISKVFFEFAVANTEGLELKCISKIRKGEKGSAPDPGPPTIKKTRGPNLGPLRLNRKIHIARQ